MSYGKGWDRALGCAPVLASAQLLQVFDGEGCQRPGFFLPVDRSALQRICPLERVTPGGGCFRPSAIDLLFSSGAPGEPKALPEKLLCPFQKYGEVGCTGWDDGSTTSFAGRR